MYVCVCVCVCVCVLNIYDLLIVSTQLNGQKVLF